MRCPAGTRTGVDVNLLERAKYLGPDVRGRVRLIDENGKTIALLPLDEAYACASGIMACNMDSADAREGIDAFIAKRKPQWKGC